MSAATPQRAKMLATNSPSKSNARRVLGDLTPKAINTPSKQTRAPDAMLSANPLKQPTTVSPSIGLDKENFTSSDAYSKGRKRSINEVEEVEDVDNNAKAIFRGRDDNIEESETSLTAAAVQTHTENDPVVLPEPGSPTECNTPSPEPELNPDLANSQKSKESFSNFIDYQLCASQQSDVGAVSNPAPVQIAKDKKSRAELLRTRLGFGIYKVKTNQVDVRGSDIIATWETSSSLTDSVNTSSAAMVSSAESMNSQPVPSITLSPVGRESKPVFVKANLDPFRPIGKLTPAPLLLPTAVSSRMIHDYHMPSSPPHSVSPELLMSPVRHESSYRTPVAQRTRTENEHGEDSDAEDVEREEGIEERLLRVRDDRFQEGDLTSSAVKGNAAKGLLELMSARR